ncbi:MAG: flippase [Desulfuromonadales bacterium]|nr:flippase [Desulfuromonadales bacterium]
MSKAWAKLLPAPIRVKLEGSAYLQQAVLNTGWQFADNILRMGVGLFVGIWLARYLGPEQFGLFSYVLAFVALLTPLATLGLEEIITREMVKDPAGREEILGSAFALKVAGGGLAFVAATGSILLLRPADQMSHWLTAIIAAGIVFQAFNVIESWFHSQVQAKYQALAKSIAFTLCSVVKIALIVAGAPLIAFAWVASLEMVIGSASLVGIYHRLGHRLRRWKISLARGGSLLRDSWPLLFTNIVIIVYMRIDQVMLGEMTGIEEVGIYSVAVRLAEVWMFIPMAIFWSVYPAIVEARATSEALLYGRLQQLYNLMAFSAYALAIPVTLSANWLVGALFGEAYARAGLMLAVLIWANVFTNLEVARSAFLSSMNWTRLHLVTVSLGALLNVGLNLLLIPTYGGNGAVVASLLSYWFAAHGTCFLFKPLFRTGTMMTKAMLYPKIW